MKTCKECNAEIREDQTICYDCYKRINNLRPVGRDEIVLDCDNREFGDLGLRRLGMMFSADGYRLEIWKAKGGKSYHIHIRNVPHITDLLAEQNKLYKELLIKKYISKVREFIEAPELEKIDFTLCVPDHLVAEEQKAHFKYKTKKELIAVINEGCKNFCDKEIYFLAIQKKEEYQPITQGSGITAKIIEKISIVDIGKQFGLEITGNKTLCPFHPDNKTPSLVFYEEQGRFYCFGCCQGGNIIKFYTMLKQINPNFKYKKNEMRSM